MLNIEYLIKQIVMLFIPHTQCLGFLLGYTKKFVLYVIFMFGVRDFEKCMGGVNCLRFFDIYKYSLPHICIYIYIYNK